MFVVANNNNKLLNRNKYQIRQRPNKCRFFFFKCTRFEYYFIIFFPRLTYKIMRFCEIKRRFYRFGSPEHLIIYITRYKGTIKNRNILFVFFYLWTLIIYYYCNLSFILHVKYIFFVFTTHTQMINKIPTEKIRFLIVAIEFIY